MYPVFATNPWFASLREDDALELLSSAKQRVLGPGEMLFRQGDGVPAGTGFFYGLARGMLRISSLNAAGKEAILLIMEPGNWFGELSLIDHLPRTHNATAITGARVLEVSADRFMALTRRASFASSLTRLLVDRTRSLYGNIQHATLGSTRAKLAHRLLLLAQGGATLSPALRSSVTVSRESLSMMLGVSRPTLQKELKQFAAAGMIELHYGRIAIVDPNALTALLTGS